MEKCPRYIFRIALVVSSSLVLNGCAQGLSESVTVPVAQGPTASADLERARSAFDNGNYGIAIQHLERELSVRPQSVAALNGLGASYDQLGRYDLAQGYYFRALSLAPDPTITLANLGYSRQLQGHPAEAALILDQALYYGPRNEMAQANMQAVLHELASPPIMAVSQATMVSEPAAPLIGHPLRVEVSNGSGINGMAARVRDILQERSGLRAAGGDVVRLTNADSFEYTITTVYYRSGQDAAVVELIDSLPLPDLRLEETDQMPPGVDVRVLLGRDFIPYDVRG